jgi:squalene-associated FAD-dependent desaturase
MKLAVVGAGWAGMTAAVQAVERGWQVTVFEAARQLGGRARALTCERPDGATLKLDNGQHILIGAYSAALAQMQRVGVPMDRSLMAMPLGMPYPDGSGMQTPEWASGWPAPLNAVAAIATARGWSWAERWALVSHSLKWRRSGFRCADGTTVARLCQAMPERVMLELIEPLCVSALNLPPTQACAQVFLRVMRDALFGPGFGHWPASSLLLPRSDLGSLFPVQAAEWIQARFPDRAELRLGARVNTIQPTSDGWDLQGEGWAQSFDQVIWATAAVPAARAMAQAANSALANGQAEIAQALSHWSASASALEHTAITTVYAWAPEQQLSRPMLALRAEPGAHETPAQFVFDRGQLFPEDPLMRGVMAFVISASEGERDDIQARVIRQGQLQLNLKQLQPIQTVVEKRATFACTPSLVRPAQQIAPGLIAAGDFVASPYPATLEGAVRSALDAVLALKVPSS